MQNKSPPPAFNIAPKTNENEFTERKWAPSAAARIMASEMDDGKWILVNPHFAPFPHHIVFNAPSITHAKWHQHGIVINRELHFNIFFSWIKPICEIHILGINLN